ncbi:MHS family MFS transporter [Agrobacterium tumefaciens]|nr:MHS family MFS transporter [Agrobacterium tumefaciens]
MPADRTAVSKSGRLIKVGAATMAGTIIEGFDFLAYGTAAALVFNHLYFPSDNPATATLAAFGAFAAGFFARPLGGMIFGHFGDRAGRKAMLSLSLLLMGIATVLIGLLPTYAQIGIWAPVLLVTLRLAQGISFGGELAGAMLMAVEHAPARQKGLFGSLPQMGSPLGLLLSTGAFALVTRLPEESFMSWGWRLPFLGSALLVLIGIFIRSQVDETPEFEASRSKAAKVMPLVEVFRHHRKALLLTIGGKLAEVTLYFTIVVFSISYAISTLGFSRADVLNAVMLGAALQVVTIPFFGWLGDRVGARRVYVTGGIMLAVMALPLFMLIGSGSLFNFNIAVILALALSYASMFGPQSALYSAQFPAEVRYTGMSLGIQIAAALGGGLAPVVATLLIGSFGSISAVGVYIGALALLTTVCAVAMTAPAKGD